MSPDLKPDSNSVSWPHTELFCMHKSMLSSTVFPLAKNIEGPEGKWFAVVIFYLLPASFGSLYSKVLLPYFSEFFLIFHSKKKRDFLYVKVYYWCNDFIGTVFNSKITYSWGSAHWITFNHLAAVLAILGGPKATGGYPVWCPWTRRAGRMIQGTSGLSAWPQWHG